MKKPALAAAAVAAVAGATAFAVPANGATTVRVADDIFRPGTLTVRNGTTVVWRWVGESPHNVKVRRGPEKFGSRTKRSGTYRHRMRRGGRYRIVCTIHPGMAMTLKVR